MKVHSEFIRVVWMVKMKIYCKAPTQLWTSGELGRWKTPEAAVIGQTLHQQESENEARETEASETSKEAESPEGQLVITYMRYTSSKVLVEFPMYYINIVIIMHEIKPNFAHRSSLMLNFLNGLLC